MQDETEQIRLLIPKTLLMKRLDKVLQLRFPRSIHLDKPITTAVSVHINSVKKYSHPDLHNFE